MALLRVLFIALLLSLTVSFVAAQDEDLADGLNVDNFYEDDEGERKYDPDLEAKIKAALENYETFDVEAEEDEEQDGEAQEQDERNFYYEPATQMSSYFLFPDAVESNVIFLGEENELLVAFKNNYPGDINITAIRLSIMHPMEPSFYYLQNCTPEFYYQTIAPQSTKTFHYTFTPDAMLQPRSYVVVTNVYFEGNGRHFVYQALNATHDFEDAPQKIDGQMIFMVLSIVGVFGLVGWGIVSSLKGGKRRGAVNRPVVSGKGGGAEVVKKDEWLAHLNQGKGKKNNKKRN